MDNEKEIQQVQKYHYTKEPSAHLSVDEKDLNAYIDQVEKAHNDQLKKDWLENRKFKNQFKKKNDDGENE